MNRTNNNASSEVLRKKIEKVKYSIENDSNTEKLNQHDNYGHIRLFDWIDINFLENNINLFNENKDLLSPKLIPFLGNNNRILDIGCGCGHKTRQIELLNNNVSGIDVNLKMVQLGQKLGLDLKRVDVNVEPFPFENDTFDICLYNLSFCYIYDTDYILSETKRVLKNNGIILFYGVNYFSWGYLKEKIKMLFGLWEPTLHIMRYYSPIGLWKKLKRSGFIDIKINPLLFRKTATYTTAGKIISLLPNFLYTQLALSYLIICKKNK